MKTYQNIFESLGDPIPMEAESKREFAKWFLPMFVEDSPGRYRIDSQYGYVRTGYAREIQWWNDIYEATEDKQGYEWDPGQWSGTISEERLLDFLEQAVEEVHAVTP